MTLRMLVLDIETSPNLAYVWSLWDQNGISIDKLVSSTEVICFAWKWVGEKGVGFASTWGDGKDEMVRKAHALLDEADVLIHFNGKRFDVPHLNREFVEAGLAPPAPYEQVDLFQAAKSRFKFPSNKLAYISKALGLTTKGDPGGFSTWVGVMAGDAKAQARMERYNKRDVVVTEAVYHRLLPWIPSHPHAALGGRPACPSCGGSLEARGVARTKARVYQRYQCKACGAWSRSVKSEGGASIAQVVL